MFSRGLPSPDRADAVLGALYQPKQQRILFAWVEQYECRGDRTAFSHASVAEEIAVTEDQSSQH